MVGAELYVGLQTGSVFVVVVVVVVGWISMLLPLPLLLRLLSAVVVAVGVAGVDGALQVPKGKLDAGLFFGEAE